MYYLNKNLSLLKLNYKVDEYDDGHLVGSPEFV